MGEQDGIGEMVGLESIRDWPGVFLFLKLGKLPIYAVGHWSPTSRAIGLVMLGQLMKLAEIFLKRSAGCQATNLPSSSKLSLCSIDVFALSPLDACCHCARWISNALRISA